MRLLPPLPTQGLSFLWVSGVFRPGVVFFVWRQELRTVGTSGIGNQSRDSSYTGSEHQLCPGSQANRQGQLQPLQRASRPPLPHSPLFPKAQIKDSAPLRAGLMPSPPGLPGSGLTV